MTYYVLLILVPLELSPQIKVVFDPDDHTNYYAHLPGGHFVYRHFPLAVPKILLGSFRLKIRGKGPILAILGENRLGVTADGKLFLFSHSLEVSKYFSF